ncbi:MAG: hypothetical protein JW904_08470 [Spirochaetales bacterium]|nr:hypothetical protein [Spirochaetales bacterium]
MDKKSLLQLKAFLLSHQRGTDPGGYISKLSRISISRPDDWNGKLPVAAKFKPDLNYCKISASTPKKPIVPWWWYVDQKEPVPSVVEDIYKNISFDYVLVYPKKNIWVYLIVEPEKEALDLLKKQDALRAFIIMSIVNKNFKPKERDAHRLRLGKVMNSPDINKILAFTLYSDTYKHKAAVTKALPSVNHSVDVNGTNWRISYPGEKQVFWTFTELIDTLF